MTSQPLGVTAGGFEASGPATAAEAGTVARSITALPGDRSIAWARCGAGPDCLIIHGTLMTLEDSWIGPVPALAERFRVTAVDRPGHGLSRRRRRGGGAPGGPAPHRPPVARGGLLLARARRRPATSWT